LVTYQNFIGKFQFLAFAGDYVNGTTW